MKANLDKRSIKRNNEKYHALGGYILAMESKKKKKN